jgi:hypothetical protein
MLLYDKLKLKIRITYYYVDELPFILLLTVRVSKTLANSQKRNTVRATAFLMFTIATFLLE